MPRYIPAAQSWSGPWLMEGVNAKVVQATNALLTRCTAVQYGKDFKYMEAVAVSGAVGAVMMSAFMVLVGAVVGLPPLRALARRFLPAPGQGPSEEARVTGYWRHELVAVTDEPQPRVVKGHCGVSEGGSKEFPGASRKIEEARALGSGEGPQPLRLACFEEGACGVQRCTCSCSWAGSITDGVLRCSLGTGNPAALPSGQHLQLVTTGFLRLLHFFAPYRQDRRDCGYWSTSRMLLETGLALVLEAPRLAREAAAGRIHGGGGVLTPAAACGPVLLDRLRGAGFEFSVDSVDGKPVQQQQQQVREAQEPAAAAR